MNYDQITMIKALFPLFTVLIFLAACNESSSSGHSRSSSTKKEPKRVEVQHILVAFEGSLPGREIERSEEEALALAEKILSEAKAGKDFLTLVKTYSDDRVPGIYIMTNNGIAPTEGDFARSSMVRGFGDLSFKLKPNQFGLVRFNKTTSPFGFHIIKRLK